MLELGIGLAPASKLSGRLLFGRNGPFLGQTPPKKKSG